MCFEGRSTPPTPCCNKPLCNKCLDSCLNQRGVTCPHCRERLPNELIVRNQEASDALLSDPDFQRRIRAVSLRFRCLCLTILRDKTFFWQMQNFSLYHHNGTLPTQCPACDVIENNPPPPNFEIDAVREIYDHLHFLIS